MDKHAIDTRAAETPRAGEPPGTRAVAPSTHAALPARRARVESPTRRALRRFRRHKLAVVGMVILGLFILLAIFAPVVARVDPNRVDLLARNLGPTAKHWFGTDRTGRDTFARTLYAGRVSLVIGFAAATISIVIGGTLGAISGYFGRWVDSLVMRFTDVVMTFPAIVILLTVAALVGPGVRNTLIIIGLLNWPVPCRLVRAKFLALREQEFVQAARAIGCTPFRTIAVHAFPNTVDVLVVYASFGIVNAILLEAGLSFLGLGVQPPTASWGNMINVARNIDVLQNYPWQWVPAGVAIVLTVLATNFIGDGVRDALDPRMQL
ncbi:MAG TPA: oligopeptide ABC transporter permease [Thermomicrobiales bacterium]|nr:oligopeptide ABC transporter permease [Thermomicrobiales bacterium]